MAYKNPLQMSEYLLKTEQLTPDRLNELKSRFKGKDYDEALNRISMGEPYGDVLNGLVSYDTPSLRERWNRYIDEGIGSGEDTDYWNQEIIDIESQLPFKDDEEHKRWSDQAATWMGEPEWLNLTDELIKRYEGRR